MASAFLKKVLSRFNDPRVRKESRESYHGGHSTDDEKPGGKSPKLLDKIKSAAAKVELT